MHPISRHRPLLCELHAHTTWSDGLLSLRELVDLYGETGFDVARATFLSIGYYPSKEMVGNDSRRFNPGMMLRAYLTCDVWDWPCYLFGDVSYISDRNFQASLLLFDLGVAVRPLSSWQQWELRLGVENNADFQARDVQSLWYASIRYVF